MGVRSLALRTDKREGESKLEALRGEPPPDTITVRENGVAMVVDLAHGQRRALFWTKGTTERACASSQRVGGC